MRPDMKGLSFEAANTAYLNRYSQYNVANTAYLKRYSQYKSLQIW